MTLHRREPTLVPKHLRVLVQDGRTLRVPVYETGTAGLVVHRTILPDRSLSARYWTITHAASGMFVEAWIDGLETALALAQALGRLSIDWTLPRDQFYEALTPLILAQIQILRRGVEKGQ